MTLDRISQETIIYAAFIKARFAIRLIVSYSLVTQKQKFKSSI